MTHSDQLMKPSNNFLKSLDNDEKFAKDAFYKKIVIFKRTVQKKI